jgi:hypothetical protein
VQVAQIWIPIFATVSSSPIGVPQADWRAKINPESVAYFLRPEFDRQQTTIHHDSTTNSPSKNHVLPPVFAKTPCKNTNPPTQKK